MKRKINSDKFNSDLKWGTFIEFATIPFIEKYFTEVLNRSGKELIFLHENISNKRNELKKWDMKYGVYKIGSIFLDKEVYFEIKGDKYDNTGNLFFEKTCSKKASGVFATEADYFVYFLPRYSSKNFYIVKPKDLIDFLTEVYPQCVSYGGGDGGRVASFIINKNEFDEEFLKRNVGKILDVQIQIPDEFGVEKFNEKKPHAYYSQSLKDYENPLD